MELSLLISIISTALAVIGAISGAASVVARQLSQIDKRFDYLEHKLEANHNEFLVDGKVRQGQLDMLDYKMTTTLEYRVNANTELIKHKANRLEGAVRILSAALEKFSDGKYVPRGPAAWPTENAPTQER